MANYVFPKVEPPKILHSNRDLSLYKVASLSVGPLYPILSIDMLPDDWMKINTTATIESMPMIAPVMGRWKVSFDYFFEPWSNLYGFIDNNSRLSAETVVNLPRWYLSLGNSVDAQVDQDGYSSDTQYISMSCVQHTSLLDYLGVAPGTAGDIVNTGDGGVEIRPIKIAGESVLTYYDIVRNYYVNNQEGVMKFITSDYNESVYNDIKLTDIDDLYRKTRNESSLIQSWTGNVLLHLNSFGTSTGIVSRFFTTILQGAPIYGQTDQGSTLNRNFGNIGRKVGLALRTYRMDLLRGVLGSDIGSYKSFVNVERNAGGDDSFSIDTLRFANKLQQFIDRIDITGGRFSDMIRTRWSVNPGLNYDRPIYLGSHSTWLSTIDVVATSAGQSGSSDSNNPNSQLGQQSGFIAGSLGSAKQRPITIKANNYGTLMCILSIVPDVVYSQGIELNLLKTRFADIYDPAFSQLGYQDVSRFEMSSLPSLTVDQEHYDDAEVIMNSSSISQVVAKRVAWSEYMASLNRAHGDFAYGGSLDFWVLNRQYTTPIPDIDDPQNASYSQLMLNFGAFDCTTYVKPDLWNGVFADTSIYADNFRVAVNFEIDSNRAIGKRVMPHL